MDTICSNVFILIGGDLVDISSDLGGFFEILLFVAGIEFVVAK